MPERITYLFERYLQGLATAEEEKELMGLALQPDQQETLQSLIEAQWGRAVTRMPEEKASALLEHILATPAVAPVRRFNWRRLAVAASIILAAGLGTYLLLFNQKSEAPAIVQTQPAIDVKAPATNRAMITLTDGSTVYLDSASNGQLAMQGNIKLVKLANGQIAYETTGGEVLTEIKYNTLSNPRGSKVIDMALADGSHVWLNAGSSVTYPIAFIGKERNLTITGEAYFEVASDKTKPFKVNKGETTVEVLGTHFNVNAYDDENDIRVTLLEGSVKVSSNQRGVTIQPGQQAAISGSNLSVNKKVDVEQVMAWKNGMFQFNRTSVDAIMREVSRWYDAAIVYENEAVKKAVFTGDITRRENASAVLKMLELTGAIHFRIEGNKIYVRN